jgi:hypothetical protein
MSAPVKLTPDLLESFAGLFLSSNYDEVVPNAPFHREVWGMYCSDHPQCAVAAPRGSAKSTNFTLVYGLAVALFREQSYTVLLGSSEEMAAESIGEFSYELHENEDIQREFRITRFITDTKTDLIVECKDGYQFRIIGRGPGQKIRGRKWRGKRPGLLLFDDVEDDEQVETKEQRTKFLHWFFRAAKQCLRVGGKCRGHGTILHEDSMLANLMKNPEWLTKVYRAHASFNDFSQLLWPERLSEEVLRRKQRELIAAHDAAGYSQEILNDPQDNADAYLRKDDFIPMKEADHEKWMHRAVGWDFAVSKSDLANRTSFTVGGKDTENLVHHLDFGAGYWSPTVTAAEADAGESGWVDKMFEVDKRWAPEEHFVEGGTIWNAVKNFIFQEMQVRDHFLNIVVLNPVKDKATRGKPLQKRHRAGATRWNTEATGYEDAKQEMLRFTGVAAARLDDQFDSCATLHLGLDGVAVMDADDAMSEEEWAARRRAREPQDQGRSRVTGY